MSREVGTNDARTSAIGLSKPIGTATGATCREASVMRELHGLGPSGASIRTHRPEPRWHCKAQLCIRTSRETACRCLFRSGGYPCKRRTFPDLAPGVPVFPRARAKPGFAAGRDHQTGYPPATLLAVG